MLSSSCRRFSLREIKMATRDFADEVGSGGSGIVYRGHLSGNSYHGPVAVKRGNKTSTSKLQEERKLLSKCHHRHVVSLVGYCDEQNEQILVFEFMPKGSLSDCLFKNHVFLLTMKQRLEICIGAANGLDYLHSGVPSHIIHSDVKSDNILLDDNYIAKISDLGLSRTRAAGQLSSGIITDKFQGTPWYLAPECYNMLYKPSRKADVYAFGMVLLEVLCEKPAWENLAAWALPSIMKGRLLQITGPYVRKHISPECSRVCEILIKDCLDTDPEKRPDMYRVVADLESALKLQEGSLPLSKPYFEPSTNRDGEGKNKKFRANSHVVGSSSAWTNPTTFSSSNNRLVLYFTSSRVVVPTHNDCHDVRQILEGYGKRVDERDLYLDPSYKKQIQSIFNGKDCTLPKLFIGGNHVGGADEVKKLHESGKLKEKLKLIPERDYPSYCTHCGNARFVPCPKGNCKECNANELIRCPTCCFWMSD